MAKERPQTKRWSPVGDMPRPTEPGMISPQGDMPRPTKRKKSNRKKR